MRKDSFKGNNAKSSVIPLVEILSFNYDIKLYGQPVLIIDNFHNVLLDISKTRIKNLSSYPAYKN